MQLVYFNDLHKNLGCNRGITAKISIIPVTFTVLPVKFYALQLPPAPIFFCPLSPSADKHPTATDISIAQKTCVFRPVDISVPAAKRSELIYQSVYSLLGGAGGDTPSVCSLRSQPPSPRGRPTLSVKAYGFARFPLLSPAATSSPGRGKSFLSGGAFWHLPVSRAKPPPFGGGGTAQAVTERVRSPGGAVERSETEGLYIGCTGKNG